MRLGVVAPVADHRIAAAAGTAYTLAPAMLAYQREALGVVQQGREIDQIDGWHDGGGSSHEPVSYSRSRLQARPPLDSRPRPDPTTLKDDKSHGRLILPTGASWRRCARMAGAPSWSAIMLAKALCDPAGSCLRGCFLGCLGKHREGNGTPVSGGEKVS